MLNGCGGGESSNVVNVSPASTTVDVFDPAAIGCIVTIGSLTAIELGKGKYSFASELDEGAVVTAQDCKDDLTNAQLPKITGVMQTNGVVISPITTLIVAAASSEVAQTTKITPELLQAATAKIVASLGLGDYEPVNPAKANYVVEALADTIGASTATVAMRAGLAITTLIKAVEISVGATSVDSAVGAIATAIADAGTPVDLTSATSVTSVLTTATNKLDQTIATKVMTAATAVVSSVNAISSTTGKITDAITATKEVSTLLNDATENSIKSIDLLSEITISINSAPTATAVSFSGGNAGRVVVGDTLTGRYTYADDDGDTEGASTYQWLRNDSAISGATLLSYTLVAADSGSAITFQVTPLASTGAISGDAVKLNSLSVNNSVPTASNVSITDDNAGNALAGDNLSGSYNYADIDNDIEGTSRFQWLRDSSTISGATTTTYTLVIADIGTTITFEVTPVASTGEIIGLGMASAILINPTKCILDQPQSTLDTCLLQ